MVFAGHLYGFPAKILQKAKEYLIDVLYLCWLVESENPQAKLIYKSGVLICVIESTFIKSSEY